MNINIEMQENDFCYNTFFKNNFYPMLLVDLQTLRIIDANIAACSFYKYQYEELLELQTSDINTLPKDEILNCVNQIVNQTCNNFKFKHRLSNGEIKDVKVSTGLIVINNREYLNSVIYDDTENKAVIEEMSKISDTMQMMLDNLPFTAWFKDINGKYAAVNNAFIEYFEGKFEQEKIIGKTDYELFSKEQADLSVKSDTEVIHKKKKGCFVEKNEKGLWFEEYKSPVFNKNGNVIGIIGVTRDITIRKLREEALYQAEVREKEILQEAIDIKDNFISLITHEFKTPITVINAALQVIDVACKDEITDRTSKYLNKIMQNSLRLQKLVDNLLDLTRLKAGRMKMHEQNIEIVSFTKELIDSVQLFAQQKSIKIIFNKKIEELYIVIDSEIYERIILNLLSNAIKFSDENRNVVVTISKYNNFLKVVVKDQGVGIPKEKQNLIFEQFGQADSLLSRKAEGTGIGLYLVKLLIDSLEGKIKVNSGEGAGTAFSIFIPIKYAHSFDVHPKKCIEERLRHTTFLELSDMHINASLLKNYKP